MKDPKPKKADKETQRPNEFYKYSGMAIKMGAVILLGVLGGQKLDETTGNEKPVYTIIFSLLSVAIAIYIVISDTKR